MVEDNIPEFEGGHGRKSQSSQTCDFCEIIKGEVPRYIVFEDNISIAFLDRRPVFVGHCLLVPKAHYETISDLPREVVGPIFCNVQLLAQAVKTALKAHGTFIAINNTVSQSVPHLHIHVVPRKFGDGLKGFFWPRGSYQSERQMEEIRDSIRAAVQEIKNSGSS